MNCGCCRSSPCTCHSRSIRDWRRCAAAARRAGRRLEPGRCRASPGRQPADPDPRLPARNRSQLRPVAAARRLLASLDALAAGHSILEVALDLGYAQSAFSAMFRRTLGVSPSLYFGRGAAAGWPRATEFSPSGAASAGQGAGQERRRKGRRRRVGHQVGLLAHPWSSRASACCCSGSCIRTWPPPRRAAAGRRRRSSGSRRSARKSARAARPVRQQRGADRAAEVAQHRDQREAEPAWALSRPFTASTEARP